MRRNIFAVLLLLMPVAANAQIGPGAQGLPLSGNGTITVPSTATPAFSIVSPPYSGSTYHTQFGFNYFSPELLLENFEPYYNVLSLQNDANNGYSAVTLRSADTMYPGNNAVSLTCSITSGSPVITCPANTIPNGSLVTGTGMPTAASRPFATVQSGGGTPIITLGVNALATNASAALVFEPPYEVFAMFHGDNGNPIDGFEHSRYDANSNPLLLPTDFRIFATGGQDATGGTTGTCAFTASSTAFSCSGATLPANGTMVYDGTVSPGSVYVYGYAVTPGTTIASGGGTTSGVLSAPAVNTIGSEIVHFISPAYTALCTQFELEPIRYTWFYDSSCTASMLTLDRAGKVIQAPSGVKMTFNSTSYTPSDPLIYVNGNVAFGPGLTGADFGYAPIDTVSTGAVALYFGRRSASPSIAQTFQFEVNVAATVIPSGANPELDLKAVTGGKYGLALDATTGNVLFPHNVAFGTAAPTISACGTSPSVDSHSSNMSGTVTVGTGTATSCTITFATAFATWNHCRVTSQTAVAALAYSYTKSAIVVTGTSLLGGTLDYQCDGL